MKTSFEPNDELCKLWQGPESSTSREEVRKIMTLVETRAKQFERRIFWRNAGEYLAAAVVAGLFALLAHRADAPLVRLGHLMLSAGAAWVLIFLWLMQRSRRMPSPESSTAAYKRALLAWYDRQILLTRNAWAWYVLPLGAGLVVSSLGQDHATGFKAVMAGLVVAVGVGVAILNRKAARNIEAEKHELERLLENGGL